MRDIIELLKNISIFFDSFNTLKKSYRDTHPSALDRFLQYMNYDAYEDNEREDDEYYDDEYYDDEQATIDEPFYLNKEQKSTVDKIYDKKKKQFNKALLALFLGMLIYYFIHILFDAGIKIGVFIILGVSIVLIITLRLLVSYRVKKGYYGMNYEECKELIYFLMDNKDNNNIDNGKKIFNEIEDCYKAGQEATVVAGELQY